MARGSVVRRKRRTPQAVLALEPRHGWPILVVAVAGLIISLYLTYVHFRLRREPGWQSLCAISATINCDAVILSPFGSLGGVPLSVFGAWFYILIALVTLAGVRGNRWRFPRSPAIVLYSAGLVGTGISLILATVSVLQIGSLCLLCASLYAVNLALLVFAWRAVRRTNEPAFEALAAEGRYWRRHFTKAAASAATALTLLALITAVFSTEPTPTSTLCDTVARSDGPGHTAPVSLLVYVDFQCPHCRTFHHTLRAIRGNPGVSVTFRHYPLDSACNPRMQGASRRVFHRGACLQASAAICAATQGRGLEFSDRVFDDGPADQASLVALAASLGLDAQGFGSCLESGETKQQLAEDIRAGTAAGVKGTPTVFVNGRRYVGGLTERDLACLKANKSAETGP